MYLKLGVDVDAVTDVRRPIKCKLIRYQENVYETGFLRNKSVA